MASLGVQSEVNTASLRAGRRRGREGGRGREGEGGREGGRGRDREGGREEKRGRLYILPRELWSSTYSCACTYIHVGILHVGVYWYSIHIAQGVMNIVILLL